MTEKYPASGQQYRVPRFEETLSPIRENEGDVEESHSHSVQEIPRPSALLIHGESEPAVQRGAKRKRSGIREAKIYGLPSDLISAAFMDLELPEILAVSSVSSRFHEGVEVDVLLEIHSRFIEAEAKAEAVWRELVQRDWDPAAAERVQALPVQFQSWKAEYIEQAQKHRQSVDDFFLTRLSIRLSFPAEQRGRRRSVSLDYSVSIQVLDERDLLPRMAEKRELGRIGMRECVHPLL